MNQILKDAVYNLGTDEQLSFMSSISGMNEEEGDVFRLLHKGKSDIFIQQELGMSKNAYKRIEDSVRKKLSIGVFSCIVYRMEAEKTRSKLSNH